MLELYHWEPNLYFLKPLIALKEKNAGFESRYFDASNFEQFAAGFPRKPESDLQLEREGPILVHDGTVMASSFFLIEYIAEAFPGTELYPGDAFARYRARAWGQFLVALGTGVSALGCAKYLAPVLKKRGDAAVQPQIERIEPEERRAAWRAVVDGSYDATALATFRERLRPAVERIEATLAGSPWLAGPAYSVADIDAFAALALVPDLAPEVVNGQATPRILEFLERMRARPAVRAALAMSRTGKPQEAYVPGAEPSRWG